MMNLQRCLSRVAVLILILAFLSHNVLAENEEVLTKVEIARRGKTATALIEVQQGTYGTAFCVHSSGLFITNHHVLRNATRAKIILNTDQPEQTSYEATVIRSDEETDLALLEVKATVNFSTLPLGTDSDLSELMDVFMFGYPFGADIATGRDRYPAISVNSGSISSLRKNKEQLSRIQLNAAVNPGNSGGPILDETGHVIGIIQGRVEGQFGAGVDFAIPVGHLKRFLTRPEIQFTSPVVNQENKNAMVSFQARSVSILPGEAPVELEMILGSSDEHGRHFPMKLENGIYVAEAIPFEARDNQPSMLKVTLGFPDGIVTGSVADQSIHIGESEHRLSEVLSYQATPTKQIRLAGNRTVNSDLAHWTPWDIQVGGQTLKVDPSQAVELKVDPPLIAFSVNCTIIAREDNVEVGRLSAPIYLEGVARPGLEAIRDGLFIKPLASEIPVSYLNVQSSQGDYIGGGKSYSYKKKDLTVTRSTRGVTIGVDGWNIEIGGPNQEFLQVGEYPDAKRHPFSGSSPGLNFSGNGRGCNQLSGKFVVWELEVNGNQIERLAVDFIQYCEGTKPPLCGMLRINSRFH